MAVYITGDTHGDFRQIENFCAEMGTKQDDIMMILGDAGFNYFGDIRDDAGKMDVSHTHMTYFLVHGNHEMRPETVGEYRLVDWNGGMVYQEARFPRLLFAKDGEIYRINGRRVLVIGGAYSIDKEYRLRMGYRWFPDEQPSEEVRRYVEQQLDKANWNVDVVLTHTCPRKHEPVEHFLPGIDQSKVDKSTENWLGSIEDRLDYREWYCGHWHINKKIDKLTFLFHDIRLFT